MMATLTWQQMKASGDIGRRSSHGCSVYDNSLFVLGGEKVARTPVDSVIWKLSLSSDEATWSQVATKTEAAPSPRIAHAQCVSNGCMFVFGGRQGVTMEESPLQDLWSFSFDTSTWTLIQSKETEASTPPTPRSFHRMISVGSNTLYVFGGCGAAGRLNDLYSYDIEKNVCAGTIRKIG